MVNLGIRTALKDIAANEVVVGVYEFGSSNLDNDGHNSGGDIDILIIAEEKTIQLKKAIDESLKSFGVVVHHPDFYSPRNLPQIYFEIIVLPKDSKYFCNPYLGVLTGLSAFKNKNYQVLHGPKDVEEIVKLPDCPETKSDRFVIIHKCQYGLKDTQARLWPLIGDNEKKCDMRRLIRFFLMDVYWVISGKFIFDMGILYRELNAVVPSSVRNSLDVLMSYSRNKTLDMKLNNLATEELYKLIPEIERFLGEFKTRS